MMNNVVIKNESGSQVLSLQPLARSSPNHLTSPHIMLEEEETMVTLQEADGNPLLLCPVEGSRTMPQTTSHHRLPPDATLTYATLDTGVNIVLQPLKAESLKTETLKTEPQAQTSQGEVATTVDKQEEFFDGEEVEGIRGGTGGPQLVVVGEAGTGDAMTYIYIQGKADAAEDGSEMEARDAHTITLNSADGSTLHTLPAAYTQHLEHTYGDLVLVGNSSGGASSGDAANGGTVNATIGEVTAAGEGGQQDEQVLLLSVRPLSLEDEGEKPAVTLPSSIPESADCQGTQSAASVTVEESVNEGRGRREAGRREDKLPEDEASTIEERLATRDSLLPPRRSRRCGDPGKLTCPVCHTQFKSGRHYHGHLQVHRGQGVWHCDMCEYTCDSAVELRVHKSEAHRDARPFKCPKCHLSFPKSLMLEDHIRSVHNKERPFTCPFCPRGFYRPYDLKMHLNLHLKIKTNVCHICGQQFSYPSNLIRHQRLHTGVKPYVCSTCGKRFIQVTLLHKHRTTHQLGAGVCPLCPATFRSAAGLRKHSKLEHKKLMTLHEAGRIIRGQRGAAGRSYYCRVCGAQFSVKSELKAHEQQEHGKSTKHRCASCNKVYSVAELKTHACFTAKEEKERSHLLSPRRSTTPEETITAMTSTTTVRSVGRENSGGEEEAEEEEEEYLVMYITSEGESVSYVMKKGSKASRDEVLQVDAPRTEQLSDDSFTRPTLPEETIMINVQDRPVLTPHQENQAILLTPQVDEAALSTQERAFPVADLPDLEDTNPDSPLPVHSIKLEPQPPSESPPETIAASELSDRSFLSLVTSMELSTPQTSSPQIKKKPTLRPISMKKTVGDLTPNSDSGEGETKTKLNAGKSKTVSPLTCKDCGKKFQKQWNFQQHIATHDASLHRYKCGMCSLTFAYRSTLNKHMIKHRPTQEVHTCKECNKKYKCLASLKQHHKRDHMRLRPFVCDICGKDFFSKTDFKYHMRVHRKEHPYICFACGREFSHVSHLHRHERVHTGERPHACPFCPKKFIQFVTLKVHLKKHEKKGSEEIDAIVAEDTFSEGIKYPDDANVGINLSVGGEIVSESSSIVANMNPDAPSLSRDDPLSGPADSDVSLDRAVVASTASVMAGTEAGMSALTDAQLPPGSIILAQGGLNGSHGSGQFGGGHAAVVTGVDGDCIAIFVQDSLD